MEAVLAQHLEPRTGRDVALARVVDGTEALAQPAALAIGVARRAEGEQLVDLPLGGDGRAERVEREGDRELVAVAVRRGTSTYVDVRRRPSS